MAVGGAIACCPRRTWREIARAENFGIIQSRWYDATVGRWLSQDPIGFGGGDVNTYRYVANDPLIFVDFTGENRYITDSVLNHVGCAVDTWKLENGKYVKTGVKTFDFSANYDYPYDIWILGAIVFPGKVTEMPGLCLGDHLTIESTPEADIRMLEACKAQVKNPPLYSVLLFFASAGNSPSICTTWSDCQCEIGMDPDPSRWKVTASKGATRGATCFPINAIAASAADSGTVG